MKFKEVSSVLGNKYMSLKIRGTLYKSALTYGCECWALRIEDERRLITTEMRMLHLICGKTLKDKITNEKVCALTDVDDMKEFLRGQRLRWRDRKIKMKWREWMKTEYQQRLCIFKRMA